jgi:8-oxo-dGTP pyrophosphatase MutT (NUDIX family)
MEVPPPLLPPPRGGRPSAVLVLFAEGAGGPEGAAGAMGAAGAEHPDGSGGPDLLLIQRSEGLRLHAGQPAFPGGAIDGDEGPVAAALREAAEEVGLDPAGVDVLGTLPEVFIERTGFRVVPVLAWWRQPCAVAPVDPREVAAVERVGLAELADPAARLMVRMPSGRTAPGFRVRGMLIWGFTAALVDRLLALAGWERPWDAAMVMDL